MHKENIPAEIFDLLAIKSFEQLSVLEKELVEPWLSATEYERSRSSILAFQAADQSWEIEVPPPPFKRSFQSGIRQLLSYPIPAYQVALGFLVVFGLFYILKDQRNPLEDPSLGTEPIAKGISIDQDEYPEDLVFYP